MPHNTDYNKKIASTPNYLNFGLHARQPSSIPEKINRKFYGEGLFDQITQQVQFARQIERENQDLEEGD